MTIDQKTIEKLRRDPDVPDVDLSWLNPKDTPGIAVKAGKRGLTLDEINIGVYGEVPDLAQHGTTRVRGSTPRSGVVRTAYFVPEKSDIWADNATLIYEEAVQRQWSSATDIPWETVKPLPDDVEEAICQICTFLTEVEFIAGDAPGQWLKQISPDHYEVALYLVTQVMDEARHLDVFRKRALVNGCGLLEAQGATRGLRNILDAKDFTEMSALMHVLAEGFVQTMFRTGEFIAQNEAEKTIFRLCAQDESRHVGFGVMHLRYVLEHAPERREEIHHYLDRAEQLFGHPTDGGGTSALQEALMITMGGGKAHIDKGAELAMALTKKQANEYMHRLEVAGLGDRRQRMNPAFGLLLDPPKK
ncbi:MAG: ferritin-like domain-containing protein [Chloroflexi bacterium]|nr:ferritin-like domain-containing protein [Chloroflexota bacterium]